MEFWLDEKIGSLPPEARLLYIGTWSLADDNGVLRGNPAYIRSQLFAYDEDLATAVFSRLPKIARAVKKSNPAIKGMNIINNNGEVAYQSVFHSHIHLVPRYTDQDDFKIIFKDNSAKYDEDKYKEIQQAIVKQMEDEQ